MSFKAFVWAWDQDVPNGDFHHVLLALANIAPAREVRASVAYIAGLVRRSPRKVRSALAWLAEARIIAIEERPGRVDLIRLEIPKNFTVAMDDDEAEDLEKGRRGRPPKTPALSENPCTEEAKPLANPSTPYAAEPIEPDEPRRPTDVGLSPAKPGDVPRMVFDAFNSMADRHGWVRALKLTDDRRRRIKARVADANGLESFLEYLADIENSDFLMGRTTGARGSFPISLDFLLQPSSFTKLMEGFYHRGRTHGPTGAPGAYDPTSARNHGRTAAMFAGAALAARGRAPGDA